MTCFDVSRITGAPAHASHTCVFALLCDRIKRLPHVASSYETDVLERRVFFVGISGSALAWFKSYLSDRHQFVAGNEDISYQSEVQYGVPQGSVLGPFLFTLYRLPWGDIIRKHGVGFHCYADDTQLYISLQPDETYQFAKLTECIVDIKNWMTSNFLLLYSEKNRGVNYWT